MCLDVTSLDIQAHTAVCDPSSRPVKDGRNTYCHVDLSVTLVLPFARIRAGACLSQAAGRPDRRDSLGPRTPGTLCVMICFGEPRSLSAGETHAFTIICVFRVYTTRL